MDCALELIHENPRLSGTHGSAILRKAIGDKSNLGESVYLQLLGIVKGVIDREQKLHKFLKLLADNPADVEVLSWLLFGRAPYLEQQFSYRIQTKYDFARNLLQSARRTIDKHLPTYLQLDQNLPVPPVEAFRQAFDQLFMDIVLQFSLKVKLSKNQKSFLNNLLFLFQHKEQVCQEFQSWTRFDPYAEKRKSPLSHWTLLKYFSIHLQNLLLPNKRKKKTAFFSILRKILLTALTPYYKHGVTVKELLDHDMLPVEKMVTKPYQRERVKQRLKQPLQLIMSAKYVVDRPGNNIVLTDLALEQGNFTIGIWPYRKPKQRIEASVIFHGSIRSFLEQGAKIQMLVLEAGDAPGHQLQVKVVLKGQRWMFFSRKQINEGPKSIQAADVSSPVLGVDANRIGPDVLAFSDLVVLPDQLVNTCRGYHALYRTLSDLHLAFTRAQQWAFEYPSVFSYRHLMKINGELDRVYDRQRRLRDAIHQQCGHLMSSLLVHGEYKVLAVEDLDLTARHARGALAKAILNMPDEIDLFERSTLVASWITDETIQLVAVDPRNTSRGKHLGCPADPPGNIRRTKGQYDIGICTGCNQPVNTHNHAAKKIRARAVKQLQEQVEKLH